MMVHLVPGWERLFSRRVPAILSSLSSNLKSLLKTFHDDVAKRSQLSGIGIAALPMLEQQLENYEHNFKEDSTATGLKINEKQKEINRQFVPFITNVMTPAYIGCVEERGKFLDLMLHFDTDVDLGPGSFKRMQSLMLDHVIASRNTMFKASCAAVKKELNKVLREAKDDLNTAADMVSEEISRDYRSTFSGTDLKPGQALPKWHRDMRKAVLAVLGNIQAYLASEPTNNDGNDDNAVARQLTMENTIVKPEDQDDDMRSILGKSLLV